MWSQIFWGSLGKGRGYVYMVRLCVYGEFCVAIQMLNTVATRTSRFFDDRLRTHRFPCRIPILSLQPLLQSLHHQRRLMLRKTLPLRRLRFFLLFLLRVGCFVDPSIIRIQDDRLFFPFLIVRNLSPCFCFLSCFYSREGNPGAPHTSSFSLSSFS